MTKPIRRDIYRHDDETDYYIKTTYDDDTTEIKRISKDVYYKGNVRDFETLSDPVGCIPYGYQLTATENL